MITPASGRSGYVPLRIGKNAGGGGGRGSIFAVLLKANGTDGDSWPKYDLYAMQDTGLVTKLNHAGALVPKDDNGQARWPQRASGAVPIAAPNGSVGMAYYDTSGLIQLIAVPEKLCTNTGTGTTTTIDGGLP